MGNFMEELLSFSYKTCDIPPCMSFSSVVNNYRYFAESYKLISAVCFDQAHHYCLWYPGLWWNCWKKTKSKCVCSCLLQSQLSTIDHIDNMILHDSPFYRCWAFNENMNYWWIIRLPILFASLVSDWTSTHCKCVVHAQLTLILWSTDQLFNFHEDPEGNSL